MAFGGFNNLSDVALRYQITLRADSFVQPAAAQVDSVLRAQLEFDLANAPVTASESAVCEFIIAPILQKMWRTHYTTLTLWSHTYFGRESPLLGFPDYFFSRKSPLGSHVMDRPYLLFAEPEADNFDAAWAHCLAAMLAAKELNVDPATPLHGIVSSGMTWYFGRLRGQTLDRDPRPFVLTRLDELWGALVFVFDEVIRTAAEPGAQP